MKQGDHGRARAEFQAGVQAATEWIGFRDPYDDSAPPDVLATLERELRDLERADGSQR